MKRAIAMLAAATILAASAAPADARRWHHHHDDLDGGDVVAGAVVVGGIAAIASAIIQGNHEKQDAAVDACSQEAEQRIGGHVAEIGKVSKSKGYYTVEGLVEAEEGGVRQPFSCTIRNGTVYGFHSPASGPTPEA